MAKVYTKKGDYGSTSTLTNRGLIKSHPTIRTLGAVDIVVAQLGLVRAILATKDTTANAFLRRVQGVWYLYMAEVGGAPQQIDWPVHTKALEIAIDALNKDLPRLKDFVVPGECVASATIHVARTVIRQQESELVACLGAANHVGPLAYINRLSDLLFTLARYVALKEPTFKTGD